MKPLNPRRTGKARPEAKIQDAIIEYLRQRSWYVKVMHGSTFQSGFPDLFATHAVYGPRLIEVKLPGMKGSRYTAAQLKVFPQIVKNGTRIHVLTGASKSEYQKLFGPTNWHMYLGVMK